MPRDVDASKTPCPDCGTPISPQGMAMHRAAHAREHPKEAPMPKETQDAEVPTWFQLKEAREALAAASARAEAAEKNLQAALEDPVSLIERHKHECKDAGCRVNAYEKDLAEKAVKAILSDPAAVLPAAEALSKGKEFTFTW